MMGQARRLSSQSGTPHGPRGLKLKSRQRHSGSPMSGPARGARAKIGQVASETLALRGDTAKLRGETCQLHRLEADATKRASSSRNSRAKHLSKIACTSLDWHRRCPGGTVWWQARDRAVAAGNARTRFVTASKHVNFSSVGKVFVENKQSQDESFVRRMAKFVDELIWMARAVRNGRENVAPV